MDYKPIKKDETSNMNIKPNLSDYKKARNEFEWEDIRQELDWLGDGKINIAYEAIDRHMKTPLKDKAAMYWEGKNGEREDYTFADMSRLTNRFANVLKTIGVEKGDRVFTYMDRIPEQYISLIGVLKAGGVIGPLFSAFGPDAIKDRLGDCEAKVIITIPRLVKTIHEIIDDIPSLKTIIIVNKSKNTYDKKM